MMRPELFSSPQSLVLGWLAAVLLTLLCILILRKRLKRYRLMRDTPTSRCQGVFIGDVELKGTVRCQNPLPGYFHEVFYVAHRWRIEEEWRRLETETYTDKDGKHRTRTVTRSGWTTIASHEDSVPFELTDSTGAVRVLPDGAELEMKSHFSKNCTRSHPFYSRYGLPEISGSTGRRRFNEEGIVCGAQVYLFGTARMRSDIVGAEIAKNPDKPLFLISVRSEEAISSGLRFWNVMLFLLSALIWGVWLGLLYDDKKIGIDGLIAGALGFTAVFAFSWVWGLYNNLRTLHNRVKHAKSLIDIQLKRRHDLIPALEKCVGGFAEHERYCLEMLAVLRSQTLKSSRPEPVMPMICATAESYPLLRSSEVFLSFQQMIVDAEDRIALAHNYHNDIAANYNTAIETFPAVLAAQIFGFQFCPYSVWNKKDFKL